MRASLVILMTAIVLSLATWAATAATWSFESGADRPEGWTPGPGATWASGVAHTGERSLAASTTAAARAWSSEALPLEAGQSDRLSGWIRCGKGEARLGVDWLDEAGRAVASAQTPPVSASEAWQYVALERDLPPGAATARLWFGVNGEASLDDVTLTPLIFNLLYNPTFDADSKGRLGFWPEDEKPMLPGPYAGALKADPAGGRTGSAMLIEAEKGSWGGHMVSVNLPKGYLAYHFSGWSRADKGEVHIWVGWADGKNKVIRADAAKPAAAEQGWTRWEAHVSPAPGAVGMRMLVAVRNGKAWFDDFSCVLEAPAAHLRPLVRVHVNQVGYELKGPKSLVVATNFFPAASPLGELRIRSESGDTVARLPLRCSGRIHEGRRDDWGDYYWRADFSSVAAPGKYRAEARFGRASGTSYPFEIAKDAALNGTADYAVDFFFVQRCGFDVPGWHDACHLDDAKLPNGAHLDATGGWHSAGDYNKIMYENGDGGCAYALLQAGRVAPEIFAPYDRNHDGMPDVLDEAIWGCLFVAKMQIPATGGLYNTVGQGPGRTWMKWSPPDLQTDNLVGTPDDPVIAEGEGQSPWVIGAWARLSTMPPSRVARNDYLNRAIRLFDHATQNGTQVGSPHLMLSAMDLHAVTGDQRYLDFARRSVESILAGQQQSGRFRGAWGGFGEHNAGAIATFALTYPDDPLVPRIKAAAEPFITFCLSTADNPFGLTKQQVGEGDKDYFFEPTSTLGTNFLYLGRAWAAAQIYRLTGDRRALVFASDQVDWVLGKNSISLCMFEGKGSFNPPRYHHRYDSIPGHPRGAVPGAIANGFVRSQFGDAPGFDLSEVGSENPHPSYRTSEPWLVHNLWYLMALSALPREP